MTAALIAFGLMLASSLSVFAAVLSEQSRDRALKRRVDTLAPVARVTGRRKLRTQFGVWLGALD